MDEAGQRAFRVVCRGGGLIDYLVDVEAADVGAAAAGARAMGHEPLLVFPAALSHREQHLVVLAWRRGGTECPACGYSLKGLPALAWTVCPECGLGASAGPAPPRGGAA